MCHFRSDCVGPEGTTALMAVVFPGSSESGVGQCTAPLLRTPDLAALQEGRQSRCVDKGLGYGISTGGSSQKSNEATSRIFQEEQEVTTEWAGRGEGWEANKILNKA